MCGRQETVQTMVGPCIRKRIMLEEASNEMIASIAGAEIECNKCGIVYSVKGESVAAYQTIILRKER
jgi:hypothetical protein